MVSPSETLATFLPPSLRLSQTAAITYKDVMTTNNLRADKKWRKLRREEQIAFVQHRVASTALACAIGATVIVIGAALMFEAYAWLRSGSTPGIDLGRWFAAPLTKEWQGVNKLIVWFFDVHLSISVALLGAIFGCILELISTECKSSYEGAKSKRLEREKDAGRVWRDAVRG